MLSLFSLVKAPRAKARKRPLARRATFERLEERTVLATSFSPLPGVVLTQLGASGSSGTAVFLDPNGKIDVAGSTSLTNTDTDFAVLRYNADGNPDTTFGTGGAVTTSFPKAAAGYGSHAYAAAGYPDGRILAAGNVWTWNYGLGDYDFALARYTASGGLDSTFAKTGTVQTDVGKWKWGDDSDRIAGVVLQPVVSNGKVDYMTVAAGFTASSGTNNYATYQGVLARYTSAGKLDTSFGGSGIVKTPYNASLATRWSAVALQQDKILAVGTQWSVGGNTSDFVLARYNLNGTLDTSFGGMGTGMVTSNFTSVDNARALAVDSAGNIFVAGYFSSTVSSGDFGLAKYTPYGSLDTSFNGTGFAQVAHMGYYRSSDDLGAVAIQGDQIVLVGTTGILVGTSGRDAIAMARFNANGTLDPNFGSSGTVVLQDLASSANSVAIQGQGSGSKILVCGYSPDPSTRYDVLVARFDHNGTLDPTFKVSGTAGAGASSSAALTDAALAAAVMSAPTTSQPGAVDQVFSDFGSTPASQKRKSTALDAAYLDLVLQA